MGAILLMTKICKYKMIGTNDLGIGIIKRMDQVILIKQMKSTSQYLHIFLYTSMETSFSHMEILSLIALI